ncbi:HGF [Branchiostoma lanceolatum]|uniref:HGF protein n=1 Tax=Branchiostoma lanceolatum TaxID=7740 RepID=A0A8J9YZL1_BRALA|nr:HGF [Branchiostoma lanceolatum]
MWDSQEPHGSHYMTSYHRPHCGLEQNFCRAPDMNPCPWCYTMDPETRWEYCFVCNATSVAPASTNSTVPPRQTPHPKYPTIRPRGNAAVNAEKICAGGTSRHPAGLGRTEPPAAGQDVEGRGMEEPRKVVTQQRLVFEFTMKSFSSSQKRASTHRYILKHIPEGSPVHPHS